MVYDIGNWNSYRKTGRLSLRLALKDVQDIKI